MDLLQMSFAGAVMILAVIAIRALLIHKLPKRTFLVLWGIALLRLLVPFSVPSMFSVYSLLAQNSPVIDVENRIPSGNLLSPAPAGRWIALTNVPTTSTVSIWSVIWAIGTIALALFFAIAYLRCCREFQTALPVNNDFTKKWLSTHQIKRTISIRRSSRISAPLTYGVFRPVILVPKSIEWKDTTAMQYVLAHEYVHIKRFDTATKLVLIVALCVHWFNPFVWAMYVLANRDIELSCDEAVVRSFGEKARSAYARTLISMEEARSGLTPLCNNFSKNAIEERITAIMKTKKTTILTLILACLIVVGTTAAFATSANVAADNKEGKEKAETLISDGMILSQVDENGNVQYSADEGKTFMNAEDFNKQYPSANVAWWTYDEYKAWLENEKEALQGMLGEKGYTGGRGEFVWTQEIIDETIAMYEANLQDIKNGIRLSKSFDGSSDIALAQYDNSDAAIEKALGIAIVHDNGETVEFGPYDTAEELLADLKPYCEKQVQLGNMTQSEAEEIIGKYENN